MISCQEEEYQLSSTEPELELESNGMFYISDGEEPSWLSTMKLKLQKYEAETSFELYHYNILKKYEFEAGGRISHHISDTQNETLMKHLKDKYSSLHTVIDAALDIPVFQYGFPYFMDFWTLLNKYAHSCILNITRSPITIINGRQKINVLNVEESLTKYFVKVEKKMIKYITIYENKRKQLILDYNTIINLVLRSRYMNICILEFLFDAAEIKRLKIY